MTEKKEERRKTDAYADGQRDTRLDQLEDFQEEIKPRLSRVERIVYGAVSIFGMVSYWPTIQKFLVSIGGGQ